MPVNPPPKTQLNLLASLESGEVITQGAISRRLGVSIGMINALLKRAILKGFVKVKAAPYKRYVYYLTPKGFSEKSRLVAEYLEVSLEFFRQARQEYAELLDRAQRSGLTRLALIGGGELAEIACLTARDSKVELIAVVDPGANRERLLGIPVVRSLAELPEIDAVVITDAKSPQAAFDGVVGHFDDQRILTPELLRITRSRPGGASGGREDFALPNTSDQ